MKRSNSRCALSLAALVALLASSIVSARADDDDHHWYHDRGHHRGWYKHHDEHGPQFYYAPSPVYVAPAAPVYIAPPPARGLRPGARLCAALAQCNRTTSFQVVGSVVNKGQC